MNSDRNPYASPECVAETAHSAAPPDAGVRRGRMAYLGIVVLLLFLELGLPLLLGTAFAPFRFILTFLLLLGGWRGHGWAISLMAIAFGVGILLTLVAVVAAAAARSPLLVAIAAAIGFAYAAVLIGLLYSPSLNAFFRYQEQQRTRSQSEGARASPRRDLVEMTPAAAELFHKTVRARGYPSDTTLRIVLRQEEHSRFDVQYEVPADDDRDWSGESCGVVITADERLETQLQGLKIDASAGQFVCIAPSVVSQAAQVCQPDMSGSRASRK